MAILSFPADRSRPRTRSVPGRACSSLRLLAPALLLAAVAWVPLGPGGPAGAATTATTAPQTAPSPSIPVTVETGSTLTRNGPFQGLGVQDDNNFLWTRSNERLGADPAKDYGTMVAPRLKAIHPALVRKMIDLTWLFPGSPTPAPAGSYNPADPRTYRVGATNADGATVYMPNSPMMRALYTDLNVLKRLNATVLLTIWHVPIWMNPEVLQQPGVSPSATRAGAPDAAHFALYAADIAQLVSLLHHRGYTNIAYVNAPNELDQGRYPVDVHSAACPNIATYAPGMPTLTSTLTLLHRALAAQHLHVGLFGPDTGRCEVLDATADPKLRKLVTFFDYHDFNILRCSVSWAHQIIGAAARSGRQVWITEFAGQGGGSCSQPLVPQGDVWSAVAPKVIDAVNAGVAGISLWSTSGISYGASLGDQAYYGLWNPPTHSPTTSLSINLGYYPWVAMSSQTYGEHKVFASTCQKVLGCGGVLTAFFGNGKGHTTAFLYNTTATAQPMRIVFRTHRSGPPSPKKVVGSATYTRYVTLPSSTVQTLAKPGDPNQVQSSGTVHRTKGSLDVTLPAGSFTVLSN